MSEIIIFPTDTVYGIGCRLSDREAQARIYDLKIRPRDKPLPVLWDQFPDTSFLHTLDKRLERLLQSVWPGKVTVIFQNTEHLRQWLGVEQTEVSVGVRISRHPGVIETSRLLQGPIASTSANLSGQGETYRMSDIPIEITSAVDRTIDGGTLPYSLPSTVLDVRAWPPTIVREGAVTTRQIKRLVAECL